MKSNPFPTAGHTCSNCAKRWIKKNQPPMKLVGLKRRTENYFFEIAICPYCDGRPIIEIAQSHDVKAEHKDYDE